jgi:GNAT superfamily N-acetyltransferase
MGPPAQRNCTTADKPPSHAMVDENALRDGWTMSSTVLREFCEADAREINRLAVRAFQEYSSNYSDWPALAAVYETMSDLARTGEIVVADRSGSIVGAVAYIPPHRAKPRYFDRAWPVIRSLVVDPDSRGVGVGRALTQECIDRAERDNSPVIALHTSAIMTVALPMYLRMGFEWHRDAPAVYGVPYAVYLKRLVP